MKPQYPKYTIKQGDTLQSISEQFGVEEATWKRHHNTLCRLDEIIRDHLPSHLEEIYLMPGLWEKGPVLNAPAMTETKADSVNKPIKLYDGNILFFALRNLNDKYGVVLNMGNDRIHYEIECKYLNEISDDAFRISLDRGQVYINYREPDTKLYQLADQMGKAVYPLVLDMDRERDIIAIGNHKDIIARCQEAEKKLSQYYTGEIAEGYIDAFGSMYKNPNTIMNNIGQELFFQLFFLPIQGLYDSQKHKKIQYRHISGKNGITEYNLNVSLRPFYTLSGMLVADIESDEIVNSGKCFQAKYLLYPEDHSVFSMVGSLVQKNGNGKESRIHFEIYHLNKEERYKMKNLKTIN